MLILQKIIADREHGMLKDFVLIYQVSSGGTESILLACLAYRNRAYANGIYEPDMLVTLLIVYLISTFSTFKYYSLHFFIGLSPPTAIIWNCPWTTLSELIF